tara:strand:- start:1927 stop:2157 length:231 start_codon:yes stop_codon:yes gene_type:complete
MKKSEYICDICKKKLDKEINPPVPISIKWPDNKKMSHETEVHLVNKDENKKCCIKCNAKYVIPARMFLHELLNKKS